MLVARQHALARLPRTLTRLTLATGGITDLRPLLRLEKLEWLVLDDTAASNFAVLPGLRGLRSLSLYDNAGLADLGFLGSFDQLVDLTVGNCWAGARLPVRGLASAPRGLRTLQLFGSTRSDALACLATLTKLEKLVVYSGHVDARWLAPLSKLEQLTLTATRTDSLFPLRALTRLRWLSITQGQVRDVSPLASLQWLETLLLSRNIIEDAAPLTRLQRLKRLELDHNRLPHLPRAMRALRRLEVLSVSSNPLVRLPELEGLDSLEEVWLERTRVKDLRPLSALRALRRLAVDGSPVESLAPLARLAVLRSLSLGSKRLDRRPLAAIATLARVTP